MILLVIILGLIVVIMLDILSKYQKAFTNTLSLLEMLKQKYPRAEKDINEIVDYLKSNKERV